MEKPTYTAIDYNSKENKVIEERIRNYYLPVKNVLETVRDRTLIGGRIWMEELEMYYTFFYEIRNGRRVLGKDRIKEIFFCKMNARDVLFSGFFVCAYVVVGYLGTP